MHDEPYTGPALFEANVQQTGPGTYSVGGFTLIQHGTGIRKAADALFADAVEGKLNERSGYDGDGGDRHEVAKRAARALGCSVLEVYDTLLAVKTARSDIAAERGEFHADSEHDRACYQRLKSDYVAGL